MPSGRMTIGEMWLGGDIYVPGFKNPVNSIALNTTFLAASIQELAANIPHNVNL